MYFFNRKKFEVKNIQITKVDKMIVFYNAMWSIVAHSRIRLFLSVENLSIKVRDVANCRVVSLVLIANNVRSVNCNLARESP